MTQKYNVITVLKIEYKDISNTIETGIMQAYMCPGIHQVNRFEHVPKSMTLVNVKDY